MSGKEGQKEQYIPDEPPSGTRITYTNNRLNRRISLEKGAYLQTHTCPLHVTQNRMSLIYTAVKQNCNKS